MNSANEIENTDAGRVETRFVKLDEELVLPTADEHGYYPAQESLRIMLAQEIVQRRKKARLSQADLAALAGVRQETLSRLETGKHAPMCERSTKSTRLCAMRAFRRATFTLFPPRAIPPAGSPPK